MHGVIVRQSLPNSRRRLILSSAQLIRLRRAQARTLLAVCILAVGCRDQVITEFPLDPEVPTDRAPAWSPDGQWVAFEHTEPAKPYPGIYVARVDGTERRQVVAEGFGPTWSPDGQALVFHNRYQVYRVDLLTDSVIPLTAADRNRDPAWSPNGQTIAFSSDRNDPDQVTHLWIMNADGSNPRRIPGSRPAGNPRWSADGARVVAQGGVRSGVNVVMTVFVTDTLGSDTLQLTTQSDAQWPAWSPAGEWIAYTRMTTQGEVRAIRPDGSGDRLIIASGFQPAWSPDGQRVAFSRRTATEVAIWSVDADGRNLMRLTTPAGLAPQP